MGKELHIVMRDLVSQFGTDIIGSSKFIGLISDVLAGENKYAPIIKSASQYKICDKVLALLNDRGSMQLKLDNIKQSFVTQTFVQPEIGNYIIDCYAFAIGLVSDAKIETGRVNTNNLSSPTHQSPDTVALREQGTQHRAKKDYKQAAALYIKAADLGDIDAMVELGKMYHCFTPILDEAKSKFWLSKAADLGNAEAVYLLGNTYKFSDFNKTLVLYKTAANMGYVIAMAELTIYHRDINSKTSVEWLKKAIDGGDLYAMMNLAQHYRSNKDYINAAIWYDGLAKINFDKYGLTGMWNEEYFNQLKRLGLSHDGYGHMADSDLGTGDAFAWYVYPRKEEMVYRWALAMGEYAWMCKEGHGFPKDTAKAERLRKKIDKVYPPLL